jgi:hypothetical protein
MHGGTAAAVSRKICGRDLGINLKRINVVIKYPIPIADSGTPKNSE